MPDINWWTSLPIILLTVTPLVILLLDAIAPQRDPIVSMLLAVVGLTAALFFTLLVEGTPSADRDAFGLLHYDTLGLYGAAICLLAGILLALLSPRTVRLYALPPAEYFALLVMAVLGMVVVCLGFELLTIFLGVEITAVAFYVLVGLEGNARGATEASLKYFVLSSFSSAFLIFGFAFLYAGARGSTMLFDVWNGMVLQDPPWAELGVALAVAGFAFKLTLVPFHLYAADVFEGAPTPVAALLATGSKVAGFVALFHLLLPFQRYLTLELASMADNVAEILAILAALSIVVGNVVAVLQRNIKRMLAYSSIAHGGYMLIAPLALIAGGVRYAEVEAAALVYLLAYVLMSVAAFGVALTLGARGERAIDDYAGLGRVAPGLAFAMTVALISLTGIPLTAGFVGKFAVFNAGVQAGHAWLVVVALLGSAVSAFYYLRVVVYMYMREPSAEMPPVEGLTLVQGLGLVLATVPIVLVGLWPKLVLALLAGS